MSVKYYNPNKYPVSFTSADGGRMTLPMAVPGKPIQTVEGDYYKQLVARGTLAVLTDEIVKKYKDEYLAQFQRRVPSPKKRQTVLPHTLRSMVQPTVNNKPSREFYEALTVKELRKLIAESGKPDPGKNVTRAELINILLG